MGATWNSSKMAARLLMEVAVQLPEVSIQLTAARTDILFTYWCVILLNSIFSSVSMSVIWSVTFGLSKTLCHSALIPTVHRDCETHLRSREKKIFQPTSEHGSYNKMVKIVVKKV